MIASKLTQELGIQLPSAEQQLRLNWKNDHGVEVWIKRDDLIHPIISGNKWRKLSQTLFSAAHSPPAKIISFGGGHSNHLHALGFCCQKLNIPLLAVIRGDYSQNMTPMLNDLERWGAQLEWVNKITYAKRTDNTYLEVLRQNHPNSLIIPEGGSQHQALSGVASIVTELTQEFDLIVAPVASGGTMAGLIQATQNSKTRVLGIGVLKGHDYLHELVNQFLPNESKKQLNGQKASTDWQLNSDFHFGGYAKKTPELIAFCGQFEQDNNIPIEPIYSGKLFWGLRQLVESNHFPAGCKILALHTGGLQGKRALANIMTKRNKHAVD
ncbi:pyridoxal-phosphate dependent enzyme [Alteromonas sp. M12]|uniref:1-aminocyclopropane-1-carboxylate deaminase/D-cysteine desulfhydrase n=1 Tax=Alteromonas sp. M12 TaxID=3135644 RepID=UPI00319DB2BE